MKLTFGFSPCPNDTFMFDAIVNNRIDLRGYDFDIVMDDVEALNLMASSGTLNITKLSFNAFTNLTDRYQLLNSGSALGRNCGPLLVGLKQMTPEAIEEALIAIPGVNTTANLLLSVAYPNAINRKEMLFSDVEKAVLSKEVDLGLLIHENRFTYHERGLVKIKDLGEYWESETLSPIPLGGIVVDRSLPQKVKEDINAIIHDSVMYAFNFPKDALPFIKEHAQEMDETVMYQHINLYVNSFSKNLGQEGEKAVASLFDHVGKSDIYKNRSCPIYIK